MNNWKWIGLVLWISICGCASDHYSETTDYQDNMFYIGQAPVPSHPKKANVDFFDKTCERTGKTDGYRGRVFQCFYTGE